MIRPAWGVPVLALACLSLLAQQPPTGVPTYSEAGVVQLAAMKPGPVAPNTLMSIFGKELAWVTAVRPGGAEVDTLPILLTGTGVFVNIGGLAATLELVSPGQVNFIVPPDYTPGKTTIQLTMNGRSGPKIPIEIREAAPAVFTIEEGIALARHEETYEWIKRDRPAKPGEQIRLYVSGLGQTNPAQRYRFMPMKEAQILLRDHLLIFLGEEPIEADRIGYAGVMPGFPGIYEIHIKLPETLPADPEIRVSVKEEISQEGVRLITRDKPAEEAPAEPALSSNR